MPQWLDVVLTLTIVLIYHKGETEAELLCETETEDVETIRLVVLILLKFLYTNLTFPRPLIDLERYPLDRPGSPEYDDLLRFCREQLSAVGSVDLPGRVNIK